MKKVTLLFCLTFIVFSCAKQQKHELGFELVSRDGKTVGIIHQTFCPTYQGSSYTSKLDSMTFSDAKSLVEKSTPNATVIEECRSCTPSK